VSHGVPAGLPRLLPPRPRLLAWPLAGAAAGLCGVLVEGLWLQAIGLPPAPRPWLVAAALLVLVCAVLAAAAGVLLRGLGVRGSHSLLAGALVGPLLLAPAVLAGLGPEAAASGPGLRATLGAAAGALVAGALAGACGARLEQAGVVLPGPPVWLAVAALSLAGRVLAGRAPDAGGLLPAGAAAAAAALLAGAAVGLWRLGRRSRPLVPWPAGRTLLLLLLATVAVAYGQRVWPWLAAEPGGERLEPARPGLVLLDLGRLPAGEAPPIDPALAREPRAPELAILGRTGVAFSELLPAPGPDAPAGAGWLHLLDGTPLDRVLEARGYRVVRLAPGSERAPSPAAERLADAALTRRAAAAVPALLGGRWLAAPEAAPDALERVTERARDVLVSERMLAPETPLLLTVDLGALPRDLARLDRTAATLLDTLSRVGRDADTRVAVAWSEPAPGGGLRRRLILRPEAGFAGAGRGRVRAVPLPATDVAAALAAPGPRMLEDLVGVRP